MATTLFLLLVIIGFAALVRYARHDRFTLGSHSATLFGAAGRAAHHTQLVPR